MQVDSCGPQGGAWRACETSRPAGDLTRLWSSLKTAGEPVEAGSDAVSVLFERNLLQKETWGWSRTWGYNKGLKSRQTAVIVLGDQVILDSQSCSCGNQGGGDEEVAC